ncbi:MAG: gamma-glutamyl-gamma-aminobutyrate hydrolase family protein [Acidobacteriota bacterium]
MTYKPRIGMTMRLELETRRFYLGRDYSEALKAASAVPFHLPLIADREYIFEALSHLDGILLPGCDSDPDPKYYGEDPHPHLKRVVPEKDETDLLVIDAAERLELPILGICFGMQILNVSRGGSLYQDIGSQVAGAIKHDQGLPLARNSHEIQIDDDCRFAHFRAGEGDVAPRLVNSHHHQAVKAPGENLKPIAWANDGIVEGIQDTRVEKYIVGVQWHPELSWATDDLSKWIFDDFVNACAAKSSKHKAV